MRITTNAILRNYKSNLGTSLSNLDLARNRVMTQRKFNSAKEDPSSALRASALEKKYARNEDYLSLVDDVTSYLYSQEDAASQINSISMEMSKHYGIESLNGTNGSYETRKTYADQWRGAQETMLLSLNASYGGNYVFSGSDGKNAPFQLTTDDSGKQILTYRGIDVNDPANKDILDELSLDSEYVDLGFGLTMDGNIVESSSAFNTNLPGINLIGYGQDDNGNTKNMVLLCGEIANLLDQEEFTEDDYDKLKGLLDVFDEGRSNVLTQITTIGTQTQFLETTKERLKSNKLSLTTQYDNIVNVDMAEAIMDFSWAQYAYNAALKVGNNILTPSFIDFMG